MRQVAVLARGALAITLLILAITKGWAARVGHVEPAMLSPFVDGKTTMVLAAIAEAGLGATLLTAWWRGAAVGAFGLSMVFGVVTILNVVLGRPAYRCGCLGAVRLDETVHLALILWLAVASAAAVHWGALSKPATALPPRQGA
jgi:hypothetical protein